MASTRVGTVAGSLATLLAVAPLAAQSRGIDVTYGQWLGDTAAAVYSASVYRTLAGPIGYGIGISHFDDHRAVASRTHTGGELTLGLGRDGAGPYLLGAVGLGMRHRDGNLDGQWSAGVGYAVRPLSVLSLAVEARYRVEDQAVRGFWRLDPSDRRGPAIVGRVALGMAGGRPGVAATPPFVPPSREEIAEAARRDGTSPAGADVAGRVVRTALEAMGTPYQWGGTTANGFDCSGLIQFAYSQQGIILPRVSRDQIRLGTTVERRLDALRPGDLLGFSGESTGVTHVGLYVGDGRFIHSASDGVKTSSLMATDADSRWWQRRWVSARRLLN